MIYLMNPETILEWKSLVEPLLAKGYEATNIGDFKRMDDLMYDISVRKAFCFLTDDLRYAGVFDVIEGVDQKILHFFLSGGSEPKDGWEGVDVFLTEVARIFGCSKIQLEGRLGWKRKVEPLGYKVDSLVMIKEVADESLEVAT